MRNEIRSDITIGAIKIETGPNATKGILFGMRNDFVERKISVAKVGVPMTRKGKCSPLIVISPRRNIKSIRTTTKKRITGLSIVIRNFSNS